METYARIVLRGSVAFSFIYAGIAALINPVAWLGFAPAFLLTLAPQETLLFAWSVVEIVLGVAILFTPRVFYLALVSAAILIAITIVNTATFSVVFRDISIALAAIALALFSYRSSAKHNTV